MGWHRVCEVCPFIMTMATLSAARGLALVSTNNRPIFNLSEKFIDVSISIYYGLPSLIFYFMGVAILAYSDEENSLENDYAVGGNENAAIYSGINVKQVKLIIYTIMGALALRCINGFAYYFRKPDVVRDMS